MNSDTALLVIDMQVCNFDEAAPIRGGSALPSKIENLIARARGKEDARGWSERRL
ncbi:MAG: hypothetical protein PVH50_11025 [Anaerolineae bacterium]